MKISVLAAALLCGVLLAGCGKSADEKRVDELNAWLAQHASASEKSEEEAHKRGRTADNLNPLVRDPKTGRVVEPN